MLPPQDHTLIGVQRSTGEDPYPPPPFAPASVTPTGATLLTDRLRSTLRTLLPGVLLLLLTPSVWAQAPVPLREMFHSSWGTRDGIPVGGVYRVATSPDGYVWLSAQGGLLRSDGVRFARVDSTTQPALADGTSREFWPLLTDQSGTMWATRGDDALVTYRDGRFTVALRTVEADLPIAGVYQDSARTIWVLTGRNRSLRRLVDGTLRPADLPASVPDTGVLGVVADHRNGLWIGTRTQDLWHVRDGVARQLQPPCGSNRTVRPLLQSRNGFVWVTCPGLSYFDGRTWHVVQPEPGRMVQPISAVESPDGMIWIGTRGSGVLRWHDGVVEEFGEQDGLSSPIVHQLVRDAQGAIWITTDGGLDRLRAAPFTTVDRRLGLPFSAPSGVFPAADGSIWAGSYDQRRMFRVDGGVVRGVPGQVTSQDDRVAARSTFVGLATSKQGGIWGAYQDRLYEYRDGSFLPPAGFTLPAQLRPFEVFEDGAGRTLVSAAPRGLFEIDGSRLRRISLLNDSAPDIRSAIRDDLGRTWLVSLTPPRITIMVGGTAVRQLDSSNGLVRAPSKLQSEGGDTAWAILDGHLGRIIGDQVRPVVLPELSGMLYTSSFGLLVDRGYLWITSEGGIVRVALDALHRAADGGSEPVPVRWFTELDGIRTAKMSTLIWSSSFRARDGRLWFSTPAGLAVVDPGRITRNAQLPLALIEEVIVGGRAMSHDDLQSIPPSPSRVEIHFTATGLVVPERARLEYHLDGVDEGWVPSGPERMVSYAQLRPRHYTFHVRAWNEDGVPSAEEATLSFRVLPRWYQTWWFLALLLLLVASGGAMVVFAIQHARIRTANERMQARYDATLSERTRLARELHDTLLQGFTGITLQLQALQRMITTSPRDAAINLSQVLSTADATLRDARLMVWDMRAPELDQHDLPDALEIAGHAAVADTGIRLAFSVAGPRRRVDIGVETTVLRIGREAIINAVKHASPTAITVTMHYATAQLTLLVQDDGRGCNDAMLEVAEKGGHWGIRGMRERATRSGGTLEISGGAGRGTTIRLALPLAG